MRFIPRLAGKPDEEILRAIIRLQEVQHALALEYGFKGWTVLCRHVESLRNVKTDAELEETMTAEDEARIARLEDEVRELRKLLQSLSLGPVDNDLVLHLEGQIAEFNISLGNVANNATFTVEDGGKANEINTSMANVGNNMDITAGALTGKVETGPIGNNLDITTGGGTVTVQSGDVAGGIHRMGF